MMKKRPTKKPRSRVAPKIPALETRLRILEAQVSVLDHKVERCMQAIQDEDQNQVPMQRR